MAGMVAPDLVRSLGCEVIELYSNLDSTFPDHHPDPSVLENLRDLQKKVLEEGADAGIGFDGDADRIGVVDENGDFFDSHRIFACVLRHLIENRKMGGDVAKTVSSTVMVGRLARHFRRKLIETRRTDVTNQPDVMLLGTSTVVQHGRNC